jgi:hypothetical protein
MGKGALRTCSSVKGAFAAATAAAGKAMAPTMATLIALRRENIVTS